MKVFDLPQELALHIVHMAELPPTQLLALGHQLTRSPNVISDAALDNSVWKRWASAETMPPSESNSLSKAFVQQYSRKDSNVKQELVRLYRHEASPDRRPKVTFMNKDFDLSLAACREGLGYIVFWTCPENLLREPNIAAALLGDSRISVDILPHSLFTLQDACTQFELDVPKWSKSDDFWGKFSPQEALDQRGTLSLYEHARIRWSKKPESTKYLIGLATESQRLSRTEFIPPIETDDFDLNQALSHNKGFLLQMPTLVLAQALRHLR